MITFATASLVTTGNEAIFNLKQALSSSGWIVSGSSDGTVFDGNLDIITDSTKLAATDAWVRMIAPDNSREWVFQRKTDNASWRIKRSKSGFTGSVNATNPPYDADEVVLTNTTTFTTNIGNWLVSVLTGSDSAHSWFAFSVPSGGGNVYTVMFDDDLVSGSYNSLDQDPYVSAVGYKGSGWDVTNGFAGSSNFIYKRVRHNMSSPTNQLSNFASYMDQYRKQQFSPINSSDTNFQIGLNPFDSTETVLPAAYSKIYWFGSGTYFGFWGFSSNIKYCTVNTRQNGETLHTGNGKYFIYAACNWFPWDSTTPLI